MSAVLTTMGAFLLGLAIQQTGPADMVTRARIAEASFAVILFVTALILNPLGMV